MKRYVASRLLHTLYIPAFPSVLILLMARLLPGAPIGAAMQQNMDPVEERIVQKVRAATQMAERGSGQGRTILETEGVAALR